MSTDNIMLPNRRDLDAAAERLREAVHHTPLLSSRTLGDRAGCSASLKCENLQRAGSFKIRGALNAALQAQAAGLIGEAGILTYSSGNHAQAVALAGRIIGCAATVVVPENIPPVKKRAVEDYGAEIIPCGFTSIERKNKAEEIAESTGALIIPPFDHPHIIAGQATVGLEILEALPGVEVILVPVGGGGLLAGIALAAATHKPAVRVIGIEPEAANAMTLSLEAGKKITLSAPPDTIADGLCPVAPGDLTLAAARKHVERTLLVDDVSIRSAQQFLLERAKLLVEPSGAATTAALLTHRDRFQGLNVVVVISGGNTDVSGVFA